MNKNLIHDLVLLESITNEGVNEALKKRYQKDEIYTFIGPVLISVNPFKNIPNIYSLDKIKKYESSCYWENPPHVFALSEDVYKTLKNTEENQCIIISGESGAGKTEASKLVLKYISEASENIKELEIVKNQLIASNPILESFGNAKTIRNDNSSRFGKYFEIIFDFAGNPVGGIIKNYLLEKVRVVKPAKDERDFHIFYQLLYGIKTKAERDKLCLIEPEKFNFLKKTGVTQIRTINDEKDYVETMKAMKINGFSEKETEDIKSILSAILWLGQIEFEMGKDSEKANVVKNEAVINVTKLLNISTELLIATLTSRQFEVNNNITMTHLNKVKSEYTRDSLCKDMYSKLFDWIISKINITIDPKNCAQDKYYDPNSQILIGVLDIYGFEIFDHNSFEQFCINYVNEKLQQIFIEQTLKAEQEEYQREEIEWVPVEYFNNKIVCDLIEKNKNSILAFLDEECILPGGTDDKFKQKIFSNLKTHPHLEEDKKNPDNFVVKHYAGDVEYESKGFLDKNKDLVWKDLVLLGQKSGLETLKTVYEGYMENFTKKRPLTQGMQFRNQILALVDSLSECNPHYIRCIKPNDFKRPNDYNDERVIHQIKYLGLKENVRVRRAGFALRTDYNFFMKRYKMISKKSWPHYNGPIKEGISYLTAELNLTEHKDFEMGKTKIFIKDPQTVFEFDNQRNRIIDILITNIQALYKSYQAKIILKHSVAIKKIQQRFRAFLIAKKAKDEHLAAMNVYGAEKLRRMFSINLFPLGDYAYLKKNSLFQKYRTKLKDQSEILFSDFGLKSNRNFKLENRIIIVTKNNFISSQFTLINKKQNTRFDRIKKFGKPRIIPLTSIESVSASLLPDNYFIVTNKTGISTIFWAQRKSEIISMLKNQKNDEINVKLNNEISIKTMCKKDQNFTFKMVDSEVIPQNSLKVITKNKSAEIMVYKGVRTIETKNIP